MKGRPRILEVRIPKTITSLRVDGFGHWLAGFADGEGCFYLSATPTGSHRCNFRIKLRIDDRAILEEIAMRTGLGYVKNVKAPGEQQHPLCEWMVVRKSECARLVEIFDVFPLRAKKSRDFAIWKNAVTLLTDVRHIVDGRRLRDGEGTLRHEYQSLLANLKIELAEVRKVK